ncbi:efflux transporter outer membrane subunit [Bradyrhizobium sp. ISRA443]|uniref:efflux transporter outer membrane subunit n=1 Tax=unclassified Bradyrhizobium TaxID=2631580 RepID=UPI00247A08D9|nr:MULTISPECIES: efflux transporter outer membrane subunit [unclassified Bradyrhizobium]WGR92293.1 efflux transporter outer membrane subunit [Bradyrhizobium sp. ISRA435]WGR96621.1 efflux transporter outer membrane subunit [Bradyrhizobium sp. ISRA436]WGS03508.1 efflux transporter outer membrane subunit [Bradyrhizobium sp. ISRA437]WGS10392.1 efflux transporter outer membrane subunit [Bradyrhizobium sp. ISRA443]
MARKSARFPRTRTFRPGKRPALVMLVGVGLGLSGCIPGSERPELNLEVPASYKSAGKGNADAAVPALAWWRGFRSAELTGLMESAQEYNLDIAVAIAQIVQADAQTGVSGAALLPSVTGSATAEREHLGTRSSSSTGASGTFSQYNVALSASYIVDFWGKNRATLASSEESATAARYNREVVALTTMATVANTYFQLLAAQDQIKVTRRNLAAAERILGLIKQQFAGGTASQLDVSQQEALVATQRAAIPPLEVTVGQNTAVLALLVARAPANFTVRGGSTTQIAVPRVTPGLPSELLYQRPDIRQAEAQLAASNFSVEAARAAFFPQIQLTGTTGFQSAALASLFAPGAWYYTLAASLTQPLFDGFLLESQLKLAKGQQLQEVQAYRKAVLSAFADVEKALIALQKYTLQERLQSDVVASSRKAFEVAETQLRGGTVSLITVLQAQQTLFTAENNLVTVRLNKLLAASSLFQALGGGWTPTGTLAALQ